MTVSVDNTGGLKNGDFYVYEDIQPGDNFQILSLITDIPGK